MHYSTCAPRTKLSLSSPSPTKRFIFISLQQIDTGKQLLDVFVSYLERSDCGFAGDDAEKVFASLSHSLCNTGAVVVACCSSSSRLLTLGEDHLFVGFNQIQNVLAVIGIAARAADIIIIAVCCYDIVCVCRPPRGDSTLRWREHTIRILQLGFHIGRRKSLRSRDAAAAAGPQNLGESQNNISPRGFECGTCKYTKMTENKLCWIWFSALCVREMPFLQIARLVMIWGLREGPDLNWSYALIIFHFSVRKFSLHQWTHI